VRVPHCKVSRVVVERGNHVGLLAGFMMTGDSIIVAANLGAGDVHRARAISTPASVRCLFVSAGFDAGSKGALWQARPGAAAQKPRSADRDRSGRPRILGSWVSGQSVEGSKQHDHFALASAARSQGLLRALRLSTCTRCGSIFFAGHVGSRAARLSGADNGAYFEAPRHGTSALVNGYEVSADLYGVTSRATRDLRGPSGHFAS